MPTWNEADLDAMILGVGGVAVVHIDIIGHTIETGNGIVDSTEELVAAGMDSKLAAAHRQVTIRTSTFPTLAAKEAITVAGVAYTVVERLKIEDGGLSRFLCRTP